jgi:hypothetical protein
MSGCLPPGLTNPDPRGHKEAVGLMGLSPWREVVKYRSRRNAMLTADLPADAVPPTKTQVALDCCRLTYAFLGSITRRAERDSVRSAHRLAGRWRDCSAGDWDCALNSA